MTQLTYFEPCSSKTLFELQYGLQLNCFLNDILKNNCKLHFIWPASSYKYRYVQDTVH